MNFTDIAPFLAFVNKNDEYNDVVYHEGLNESKDGEELYFASPDNILKWIGRYEVYYVYNVTYDHAEANVTKINKHQFTASKLFLSNKRRIEDMPCWAEAGYCTNAVMNYGHCLRFIRDQTDELCHLAILQNANAIKHVKNQTEELCSHALHQNANSIEFIGDPTTEMWKLAVHLNPYTLRLLHNQTPELCCIGVMQHKDALALVKDKTPKLIELHETLWGPITTQLS